MTRFFRIISPAKADEGYALIETLVALFLSLVVTGLLFSTYLFMAKAVEPWRRNVLLQNHAHLIVQRLSADLTYTEQLIASTDSTWTLTKASGEAILYAYRDSTLLRNDVPMHVPALHVTDFTLTPSTPATRFAALRRDATGEDEQSLMQVHLTLTLSGWTLALTNTTTVALRLARPWEPVLPLDPATP